MESLQLSDMLGTYPSIYTPGIQSLITAKKEFNELASQPGEILLLGRGHYFNHQKFYHRFLRVYDDLLILDATGTGKSCSVFGFTEYVRRELARQANNTTGDDPAIDERVVNLSKVIILVKSNTQKLELKHQLDCQCSNGHYETTTVRSAQNEASQKAALSIEIKKAGYEITTYVSFANTVRELDDRRLEKKFSDTIFWIDEAHNLISDVDGSDRRPAESSATSNHPDTRKDVTYELIWKVFHAARSLKRIISTATPMINHPSELRPLLNLLLPKNGTLPEDLIVGTLTTNDKAIFFPACVAAGLDPALLPRENLHEFFVGQIPDSLDWTTATLQQLEPYLRGHVGYVRAVENNVKVVHEGVLQGI